MSFYPAKGSVDSFKEFEWKDIFTYNSPSDRPPAHPDLWGDSGTTYTIQIESEIKTKGKIAITTGYSHDVKIMINGSGNYKENEEFTIPKGKSTISLQITGSHPGANKYGTLYVKAMIPIITSVNSITDNY